MMVVAPIVEITSSRRSRLARTLTLAAESKEFASSHAFTMTVPFIHGR
jgi:hypothetical protein